MQFEEDFVKEDLVEFQIDGRIFKYKPTTAGEEMLWYEEYMEKVQDIVDGREVTVMRQNLAKVTQCKIQNLKEIPYGQEVIKKISGMDKQWKDMSKEERWNLLSKLNPTIFNEILKKINGIDNPKSEVKKN